jgi:Site-specific recombinases, DNA invertase Pin homologs
MRKEPNIYLIAEVRAMRRKEQARKIVVGYVRVSTAEQGAEGASLAAQRARIIAWASANGARVEAIHEDSGLSGSRADNRPGLERARADACRLRAVLIVYSLSRLARSTKDAILIAEQLAKSGADLVSLSEQIDTTSAAGKMIFRMLAVLAEFERDLVSERTKLALDHLRRSGRRVSGRIPFGFDLRCERLVPNAAEQKSLALIRRLRVEGRSLRAIAAELDRRGISAKRGGSWSAKVLADVLRRRDSLAAVA